MNSGSIKTTITFLALLFGVLLVQGQTELFDKKYYVNEEGDTLKYRLMISDYDTISSYPLVVFLHGSGERGNDNEAQLKWGVLSFAQPEIMAHYRPVVLAPQCPAGERWSAYDFQNMNLKEEPTKQMELLKELIDQTIKNMPIDPGRVYITGLSMGGFGTFDAVARYPELFAAAVPVCGGGDPKQASKMLGVPMWIFHGAKDTTVDPKMSLDMYHALVKAGAFPGLTIYPEAGHFSWIPAYKDDMMMDWLFSQHK
jgi:predicted peptidase